jgi:hypothetical protein
MSNPNLNGAQLSPAIVDFKKFNEMMGRRGMSTQHVSVMNPLTSTEQMSNSYVKKVSDKLNEAAAGAVGPFTVKIKHDDGYEDEVTSENHAMALDKASLTVADNYAPDLTDKSKFSEGFEELKENNRKHKEFEDSLKPAFSKALDEFARTWASKRAGLISKINSATGLKLGPLDSVQTREVDATFRAIPHLGGGSKEADEAHHAYTSITGESSPMGSLFPRIYGVNISPNHVLGGDILSGRPYMSDIMSAPSEDAPDSTKRHWKHGLLRRAKEDEIWKKAITKGTFPTTGLKETEPYAAFDGKLGSEYEKQDLAESPGAPERYAEVPRDFKNNFLEHFQLYQGFPFAPGRKGENYSKVSDALGIKNPHPYPTEEHDAPQAIGITPDRTSEYEVYDSTGKKLHSGTIKVNYNMGVSARTGESTKTFAPFDKRFNVRIEPSLTNG